MVDLFPGLLRLGTQKDAEIPFSPAGDTATDPTAALEAVDRPE
jgi:hypothetical protein